MREIRNVVVLGAGAMGSYFATRFFGTEGFSTAVVARGQRFDRINRDGMVVNGDLFMVPAVHPNEVSEPADLIIVALKHHHLAEAVPDLNKIVGGQTTIISVMNGLDSEEYIGSVYGMDKMLYAVSVGIDALRDGNRVTFTKPGIHYFGEASNPQISQKVRRVQTAFDRAGIAYETPADMQRMM